MQKLAVGYVRCSTDMQDGSVEQQKAEIRRFALENGYTTVRWFEDQAQSGTSFLKRPAFVEMLNSVEKRLAEFKYILVYDESRWGRGINPRENSYWKMHFARYGVKVVLVHTSSSNGNDIGSYVVEVVESAEASEYSKKLSRATLRGAIDNARRGFSCGGTPPYGYARIAVNTAGGGAMRILHPGEHIREEEKAKWDLGDRFEIDVVKRIFDLKIKGLGDVAIADTLNREGVPPPKRGRWRNKDQRWSGVTIGTILKNPTYYGCRVYNRHPQSHLSGPAKEVWINNPEHWVIVEYAHPAIISKETFLLANCRRKEYTRKNRHFFQSPYLLSGLIKCSHCGFNFQGSTSGRKNRRYRAYIDGGYVNKGKSVCTDFKVNKEKLETFVIRAIRSKILKSDLPQRVEEMLSKRLKETSVERLGVLEQFERSLSEVKIRIDRLLTAVENGVEYETTIERLKGAQSEKKRLEQKIEELKSANLSKQDIVDAKAQVRHLMDNFEKTLNSAPIHVQKELLRKFILRIDVDRQSNTIILYLKRIPTLNDGYNGIPSEVGLSKGNGKSSDSHYVVVEKRLKRKSLAIQEERTLPTDGDV